MSARRTILVALVLTVSVAPAGAQRRAPRYVGPGSSRSARVPPGLRPLGPGFHARVKVLAPTRFDWAFAVPPGNATFPKAMADYVPTRTFYQAFVPGGYNHRTPQPLVLWLSADNDPDDWKNWDALCTRHGALFVAPYQAGKDVPEARRVRIALDVLDDARRRWNIDADRCYVAGMGTGGITASALAFALPEAFGGVMAIEAGRAPRLEPDLRERVKDRLSVALLTLKRSPGRLELERFLAPLLRDCKVNARLWAHAGEDALPSPLVLEEAFAWLEAGRARRQAVAVLFVASRIGSGGPPNDESWAQALLDEGAQRQINDATRTVGLMQWRAATTRFNGTAAAKEADRRLRAYNARARVSWQELYRADLQQYAYRQARAYAAYLDVALRERAAAQREPLVRTAIAHWSLVQEQGEGTKMGAEAKKRLEKLKAELARLAGG